MNARKAVLQSFREEKENPFAWRAGDCLQWCGVSAKKLIGRDPGEQLRELYDSEVSAKRVMVERGWKDMGDVAGSLLPEIPVAMARSGDWVQCTDRGGRDGLGVVCGETVAIKTETGLGQVPLSYAKRAFRVA